VRVGFDATPLLGPRSGVGTYTHHLVDALSQVAALDVSLVATPFSARGVAPLRTLVPPGVEVAGRRLPARLLRAAWSRTPWPPVEWLSGRLDVFHGTNFVAPPTRRAATVVTVHDLAYLHLPGTVDTASLAYRDLVPLALERGAHICAVSHTMGRLIGETYAVPPERIHVTPLGVDPSWFTARPFRPGDHEGLPQDYVVAVGTLEPRKNLAALVDAYRLAFARGSDLPPLVLVGAQGWGHALDTTGIPDTRLIRTGHLPFPDLQRVVAGARVLAFPSLYEGFGLPPLEALACGTPVVASDLEVTREVLGGYAVYADLGSHDHLLEALATALTHPPGTVADRRAHASVFTWEACAAATLGAYRSAAGA